MIFSASKRATVKMATVETTNVTKTGLDEFPEETLFEIVQGVRIELPPMSVQSNRIGFFVARKLADYAEAQGLGHVSNNGLFVLSVEKKNNRRPDVSFISYERWPEDKPVPKDDNAWNVVPDLAVEIISPTDRAEEVTQKIVEYFAAGVRLVWIVYPNQQLVSVHESLKQSTWVTSDETLDGGEVLPGFEMPLSEVFSR